MDFSKRNSARGIVQKSPNWKSRELDLGNRHRTTLNFGDLVPAYWCHTLPGDKFKLDCSVLAKFLPLIAPAFSRMTIKTEWFYVPLRQISPNTLRALQDFKPNQENVSDYYARILTGQHYVQNATISEDQQNALVSGFPSIPAYSLAMYFAADTVTSFVPSGSSGSSYMDSLTPVNSWRGNDSFVSESNFGMEDLVTYATKKRQSKFLSYLGLPVRLTQMRYTKDAICGGMRNVTDNTVNSYWDSSLSIPVDVASDNSTYLESFISVDYLNRMPFNLQNNATAPRVAKRYWSSTEGFYPRSFAVDYGFCSAFYQNVTSISSDTSNPLVILDNIDVSDNLSIPVPLSFSRAPISLLPMMAYQKIYNDFYRDEKLQPDEIRLYSDAVSLLDGQRLMSYPLVNKAAFGYSSAPVTYADFSRVNDYFATFNTNPNRETGNIVRLFNNLFTLRRRNREKDVFNTCVTSDVIADNTHGENVTSFTANLSAKIARYLMKKEFTGSTWAEWLSNFFGENSNDYLNNNIVFLGSKESTVSISENIQNSQSTESSAQGNRAGLAQDFHNGNSLYFRAPDFGIILCNVSIIPDEIDNFNGLQERFIKACPFDFNLPDLQDIGFTAVLNERMNIGIADKISSLNGVSVTTPNFLQKFLSDDPFGYQPFGYDSTYTPNIISGDFQTSLRYWHQSPDLDLDFLSFPETPYIPETGNASGALAWTEAQPQLNFNLPAIGLRQTPLGSNLAAQYYNNIFAVTSDESGDHCVADMRFFVTCHRNTAFFTDAIADE